MTEHASTDDSLDALTPDTVRAATLGDPAAHDDLAEDVRAMADDEPMPPIRDATPPESRRPTADTASGRKAADVPIAQAAAKDHIERVRNADAEARRMVAEFLTRVPAGYFTVERVGPSGMPDTELGIVGKIRNVELQRQSADEIIRAKWGGGHFVLEPRRPDGALAEAEPFEIHISGADPIMTTSAGRAWLKRVAKDGILVADREPRNEDGGGTNTMAVLLEMMKQNAENARQERIAEAERRREEAAREREQRLADEKRREDEAKERAKEVEARLDRERKDAEEARKRDREDERARREAEAKITQSRLDLEMERVKSSMAAHAEQVKANLEMERERAKQQMELDRQVMEHKVTNGLGWEGMAKVRELVGEATGKKLVDSLGLAEADEEPWYVGLAKDILPGIVQAGADVLLPALARKMGVPSPGPVADAAPAAPALPHVQMPGLPAPAAEPDDTEVPHVGGAAPQAPASQAAPTEDAANRARRQAAIVSVLAFARPLGILVVTRPEPDAAWDYPVGDGNTLGDSFRFMAEQGRKSLEAGWEPFVAILERVSPADAKILRDGAALEGGPEWVAAFLAAGPWNPEEE